MKNKGSLVLMELLLMLPVFALAAAWCLQIFIKAENISSQIKDRDQAVLIAQNIAEIIKERKDPKIPEVMLQSMTEEYSVNIFCEEADEPGFRQAQIDVASEGENLFTLHVAWQEEIR